MTTKVYERPSLLCDKSTHYCGGCGHGTAHKLVAEAIEHFDIRDRVVGVAPAGCSVLMYEYLDVDTAESAHGRALAVATGLKRANPDLILLDLMMEKMTDGFDICHRLKHDPKMKKIPVLAVSSITAETGLRFSPKTDGEYFQADDFVEKPVAPTALLERIDKLLKGR